MLHERFVSQALVIASHTLINNYCAKLRKFITETFTAKIIHHAYASEAFSFEWYSRLKIGSTSVEYHTISGRSTMSTFPKSVPYNITHSPKTCAGDSTENQMKVDDSVNVSSRTEQAILICHLTAHRIDENFKPTLLFLEHKSAETKSLKISVSRHEIVGSRKVGSMARTQNRN